jgi:hypothetical protein
MAKRGRPPLDDFDRQELEGRYLFSRADLSRRLERAPTIAEVADYMGVSVGTVSAIRARMRSWRAETAASLGWDAPTDSIDWADWFAGWTFVDDLTRERYLQGLITTEEAAKLLGLDDERELRRWRSRRRSE